MREEPDAQSTRRKGNFSRKECGVGFAVMSPVLLKVGQPPALLDGKVIRHSKLAPGHGEMDCLIFGQGLGESLQPHQTA